MRAVVAALRPTPCGPLLLLAALAGGQAAAAEVPEPGAAASVFERRAAAEEAELARRVGRPEAVASLAALLELDDNLPAGRLDAALRAAAEDRRSHPLVAAQAEYQRALREARAGDLAAAERRWRALGLIEEYQVVGPFDAQGRGGLGRVFPPEEPGGGPNARPDGRSFPGKEREVAWRSGQRVRRLGALALDGLLRPDSDAVAYVLIHLRSQRPRRAVLRLGSGGPTKIWLAGRVVFEQNVVREARFDQDAALVAVPAGETTLLVKTVITAGAWRLFLRFTDVEGRPLPGLNAAADGRTPLRLLAARPGAAPAPAPVELGRLLRARAQRARGAEAAAAWFDLGRWLWLARPDDREGKEVEAVLEQAAAAGAGAPALLLLGDRAVEEEDRRRAFERAAAERPDADPGLRALALAGQGEIARGRRRAMVATALFRQALALDPHNLPATLALASEEQLAGLSATALRRLEALPPGLRDVHRARLARARVLEALGRRREAERELEAAFAQRRTDVDLALDLARDARQRGDLARAVELTALVAAQRPELSFVPIELARLQAGRGDLAAARAALAAAIVRLPDEAVLHEELGRVLVRAGDRAGGLTSLRHALALRPQSPGLRRYVARLAAAQAGAGTGPGAAAEAGPDADDLARDWAEDTARLGAEVLAGKTPASPGEQGAGSLVLLDKQVVRVHRNGLSERFVQRLVQVKSEQAAREETEFHVRYTPGSQEVEIRRAQVYRRGSDGEIETWQATGRDDRDLSEPWYGLYYDVRADVVQFEGLRPGDVVDLHYTVADVSAENNLGGYFGDLEFVAETAPRRRWEYALIGPAGRSFHFNQPAVPGLTRSEEKKGDEVIYHFKARDVPRVRPEPGMPGWAEVAPYLHVSTYRSWDEVGRWYWNLIADQLGADPAIKRAAAEATRGARTTEEKVRALHRFVLENTRYVALEFGIHGYKPYRVSQVLSRRFGDCKDKASLLMVLLREVGIEADIVLLRTRRNGRITTTPASLAIFDHAIAYVPALSLYLDGTAEFSGLTELPAEDQGVTVLRVNARGSVLVETPVLPSASNRAERRWSAAVAADGGGRIEEVMTISGQAAPEWREHYQTPGERAERYGKVWNARFPGATLESVEIAGVEDRNRPVVARSVAAVPRLAEVVGEGGLRLPVSARPGDFVRTYARLSARTHEYLMGYPWQHQEELRYRLPDGWHVAQLPDGRRGESAFGKFKLEVTPAADGREVHIRSQIDVFRHRIPAGEYPAFRAFLGSLDGALRQSLLLERERDRPAPAAGATVAPAAGATATPAPAEAP